MNTSIIVPRHKLLASKFCNKWMGGSGYPRAVLLFGNFNAKTKRKLRIMARRHLINSFALCDPDTFTFRIEVTTTYSNSHRTRLTAISVSAVASRERILYYTDIIGKAEGDFKYHVPSKEIFMSTDDFAKSIYGYYNIYSMIDRAKERLIKNHNLLKQLKA